MMRISGSFIFHDTLANSPQTNGTHGYSAIHHLANQPAFPLWTWCGGNISLIRTLPHRTVPQMALIPGSPCSVRAASRRQRDARKNSVVSPRPQAPGPLLRDVPPLAGRDGIRYPESCTEYCTDLSPHTGPNPTSPASRPTSQTPRGPVAPVRRESPCLDPSAVGVGGPMLGSAGP
jgi:hypothetical protein